MSLDQVGLEPEEYEGSSIDPDMTIGELMEWRYLRAELEKEQVIIFVSGGVLNTQSMFLLHRAITPSSKANMKSLSSITNWLTKLSPKCLTTS